MQSAGGWEFRSGERGVQAAYSRGTAGGEAFRQFREGAGAEGRSGAVSESLWGTRDGRRQLRVSFVPHPFARYARKDGAQLRLEAEAGLQVERAGAECGGELAEIRAAGDGIGDLLHVQVDVIEEVEGVDADFDFGVFAEGGHVG